MAYQNRSKGNYETMEGQVEQVGRGGKGLKIDGSWYGAFAVTQTKGAKAGDVVSFEYEAADKGGQTFLNIKGDVKILEQGEAPARSSGTTNNARPVTAPRGGGNGFVQKTFPIPADHPDRSILRQNAATRALEVLKLCDGGGASSPEDIAALAIDVARLFEAYYSGEADNEG